MANGHFEPNMESMQCVPNLEESRQTLEEDDSKIVAEVGSIDPFLKYSQRKGKVRCFYGEMLISHRGKICATNL